MLKMLFGMISLNPLKRREGQGMVEYALIIILIALAVILALTFMGGQLGDLFNNIGDKLV